MAYEQNGLGPEINRLNFPDSSAEFAVLEAVCCAIVVDFGKDALLSSVVAAETFGVDGAFSSRKIIKQRCKQGFQFFTI